MSAAKVWGLVVALAVGCLLRGPWMAAAALPFALAAGVRRNPETRLLLLVAGLLLLAGLGLTAGRTALLQRGPLAAAASHQRAVAIKAVVVAEPRTTTIGDWTLVRVTSVDDTPTRARALLRLPQPAPRDAPAGVGVEATPALGSRVAFRAVPAVVERDGFGAYLRRLGVGVELRPRGALRVAAEPGRLLAATNRIRGRVRGAAGRHLPPSDAALLSGLVTGDTRGLSPEAEERFARAGLTHLVAVSGDSVGC